MTARYVLWKHFKNGEWAIRAVFQLEDGKVVGMAPNIYPKGVIEMNWDTAVLLSNNRPSLDRLEDLEEGPASVAVMEVEIQHQKNIHEMGMPAGSYFVLWSRARPGNEIEGLDEAAYGRITKSEGQVREAIILGIHRYCKGPLDEDVRDQSGVRVKLPRDLRLGEIYSVTLADVIHSKKDEIRILRQVEPDDWSHMPDQDLDLSASLETELLR